MRRQIGGTWFNTDNSSQLWIETYTYEATTPAAVAFTDIVLISDPDGSPAIIDNPTYTVSDSTPVYIGLELNREVSAVLNPEAAFAGLTVGTRTEYAYYYRRQTISSRLFLVMKWTPAAEPGDRAADISFVDVNAFNCNNAEFLDSSNNDLCDAKTLSRADLGGTGSVDIAVPKNLSTGTAWWIADWANEFPMPLVDGDHFIITAPDTIMAGKNNMTFDLVGSGPFDITLMGDNCTIYKRPWQTVNLTDNGTGNQTITLKPKRRIK
jgi:hypothetical protein